ncbi:MAG: SIMPL domain-containing protein, partial [Rhizobiales bacterium]|nr:SIMPL domain-containing protein [Hyphomicrobiales bacterium]
MYLKQITKLATALAMVISVAIPAFAQSISIQGKGIIISAPDIAYISIGVSSNAATARIALDKNNKAMNNIITALTKQKVESKDFQTSNFSINPRYNNNRDNNQLPEVIGYEVFNTLSITIRDLQSLGPILDQVVVSGSNRINNIRFSIANPGPLKDKARALAAKDAKRRAEIYAATLGFTLGKITRITEGRATTNPFNGNFPMMSASRMSMDKGSSTPVEAGEQAVTTSVDITWE